MASRSESENLEHLLLQFSVVDTERTATEFHAVADEVVGFGTHPLRMFFEQGDVIRIGHGEGVVCGHEPLFLVAPLKEREVDDPEALETVFVAQSQTVAHLQSQRAELCACLVGIVAAEYEYEVAVLGSRLLFQFRPDLWRIEFVDARLDRTILIEFDIHQAFGTHLRPFDEVGELVELFAGVVGAARHADAADIGSAVEDRESACAFEHVHQLDELHAEAQVGLVGSEASHGLVPRHLLQFRRQFHASHLFK